MSSRSFIHDLINEVLPEVETPFDWLYWSIMCTISAAAANNYFLLSFKGNVTYYPNIYVILLGESGLGKAFGITIAKKLIRGAEITRLIDGRSSIQAIIKDLSLAKSIPGKKPILDSRGFIVNGELSTGLISDPDALTLLTDLFDGADNPNWTNKLKGDGDEKLKNPYITCLFGSSPAHFFEKVPQVNIEGGYVGRNLIIFEEVRSKEIDPLDAEEDLKVKEDKIISYIVPKYAPHLQAIAARERTRLIPSESARLLYNSWRRDWRANQKAYNDKTGFTNRVPDHVLKVSMCLCLARLDGNNTIITEEDIKEAIDKVTGLIYATQKTSEGSGIDPTAQVIKKIIDFLIAAPSNELMRGELLVKGYGNFDPVVLDKCIDTLLEMKWISRERYIAGSASDWIIKLAGQPLESYKKFKNARAQKAAS